MKNLNYIKSILLTLFLIFTSCSKLTTLPKNQQINATFRIEGSIIKHDLVASHFQVLSIDESQKTNFYKDGTPVILENVLKKEETLPSVIETKIISRKIEIPRADRFILKIHHEAGSQFILPFFTNKSNVQMPLKLMFERNLENKQLKEKNFLIKIPESGTYYLHLVSFAPENKYFESSFYFGQQQTENKLITNTCSDQLAYNLRHCIPSECRVDMTPAFTPLEQPPEKIYYQYTITRQNDSCEIKTFSTIEDDKLCTIPLAFNFLIQDCGYPLKDPDFAKKLNILNHQFFNAESNQELHANSQSMQQLWLREYPISLMCSKELDFQLPDLDQHMKKYCKTSPNLKNSKMLAWKEELEGKIAVKQATLNFKSLTTPKENSQESADRYREMSEKGKQLHTECFKQNTIASCAALSESHLEYQDYELAGEASAHACNLGDAISCQKSGLHYTQAKKRSIARIYEIKGCALKDSISCYNVACGYCVDGNTNQAHKFFKKHIKLGVEDPMHVIFDPTIQCLKDTLEFQQLVKKTLAP